LEKDYRALVTTGKKDDAAKSLRDVTSAYDKAVKSGVVHRTTADRKKSRLAMTMARVKPHHKCGKRKAIDETSKIVNKSLIG
jgi:ribosomal protein S20